MNQSAWEWPSVGVAALAASFVTYMVGGILVGNVAYGYGLPPYQLLFLLGCTVGTVLLWLQSLRRWQHYRAQRRVDLRVTLVASPEKARSPGYLAPEE